MQIVVNDTTASANLRYDWNTGTISVLFNGKLKISKLPAVVLANPSGKPVWWHEGFTAAGELGLLLRSVLGDPQH